MCIPLEAERIGEEAAASLRAEMEAAAVLDVHAADQLLVYLARGDGPSRFHQCFPIAIVPRLYAIVHLITVALQIRERSHICMISLQKAVCGRTLNPI